MADNAAIVNITAVDQTGAGIASAVSNIKKADVAARAMERAALQANTASQKAARQMRAGFQQAGYQFQDIAVQMQMGTNPFTIFSQQGSQLVSVFGAGGAVAGAFIAIAGVIGSALLPKLFDSTSALEALQKAGEDVDKTFKQLESGVLVLGDAFYKLAQQSFAAATIELDKQKTAIVSGLDDIETEILQKTSAFSRAFNKVDGATAAELLAIGQAPEQVAAAFAKMYGLAEQDMKKLADLSKNAIGGTTDDIELLLSTMQEMEGTAAFSTLKQELAALFVGYLTGKENLGQLTAASADLNAMLGITGQSTKQFKSEIDRMIEGLQREVDILDMSTSQIALYDAAKLEHTDTQIQTIGLLAGEIQARSDLIDIIKQEDEATAEFYKNEKARLDGIIRIYTEDDAAQAEFYKNEKARLEANIALKKVEDDATEASYKKQADALKVLEDQKKGRLTGVDKIVSDYDERIRVTTEALDELGLLETEHADLITQLNQDKSAAVVKALADEDTARKEMMLSQVSTMQGMAAGIASSLEEGTAAQKAAFVVAQALAVAQSIMSAHLAASQVLADPLLPTAMKVPMSNAMLAMGYINAGMIAGQTVASFEGGGFTGYGSRVGGLDGKGGMAAIVHPNETIIDHTKGGAGTQVNITIQANDARGFDDLLLKRRGLISSMVQSSLNNVGRKI